MLKILIFLSLLFGSSHANNPNQAMPAIVSYLLSDSTPTVHTDGASNFFTHNGIKLNIEYTDDPGAIENLNARYMGYENTTVSGESIEGTDYWWGRDEDSYDIEKITYSGTRSAIINGVRTDNVNLSITENGDTKTGTLTAKEWINNNTSIRREEFVLTGGGSELWGDKIEYISHEKVTQIAGIPVNNNVIRVTSKAYYGETDINGNFINNGDEDWESQDYANCSSFDNNVSEYVTDAISTGKFISHTLSFRENGKFFNYNTNAIDTSASWEIVGDLLKVDYYDGYDMKIEGGVCYEKWRADTEYSFLNLTKEEVNLILEAVASGYNLSVD